MTDISGRRVLPDPKRLNHALFGAWYEEAAYLAPQKIGPLPWINRAPRAALLLSARQRRRIERADDFALIESVRRAKPALFRSAAIAAE